MSAPPSNPAIAGAPPKREEAPARPAGRKRVRSGPLVVGGLSVAWLTLIVLIPLAAVVVRSLEGGIDEFWDAITNPQAVAAMRLTLVISIIVAAIDAVMGVLIAWVLVRDEFPGKAFVNGLIDLPFALPTIVAGLTLLALYGNNSPVGINVAYTQAGVALALLFVTLPFVVRAVQPVLMSLDREAEQAAASLGAGPDLHVPADRPAGAEARDPGRRGAGLRPRGRRVRRDRADQRQHPLQDRGRIGVRVQPHRERLDDQRRRGLRAAARDLLPDAARHLLLGQAGRPMSGKLALRTVALGYLALLLLVPIGMVFYRALENGIGPAWDAVTTPPAQHAFYLTIMIALIAVPANAVFGVACAWLLARYEFRGKRLLDALVDLPFAISPVVVGLALILVWGQDGWFSTTGVIFSVPGMVLATIFVSLPFVVREVEPVLREEGIEQEQAAATLGANAFQILRRITLPTIRWGLTYGIILATARALGEFGAVAIVSGKISGRTETLTLFVEDRFQSLDLAGAYAAALVLALIAVAVLTLMTLLQRRTKDA